MRIVGVWLQKCLTPDAGTVQKYYSIVPTLLVVQAYMHFSFFPLLPPFLDRVKLEAHYSAGVPVKLDFKPLIGFQPDYTVGRCHRKSDPGLYRSGRIGSASGINPSDRIR